MTSKAMAKDKVIKLGATSKFPEGKLHESDEGELQLAVGISPEGKVIVHLGTPVVWFAMDPDGAIQLADFLKKRAEEPKRRRGEANESVPRVE